MIQITRKDVLILDGFYVPDGDNGVIVEMETFFDPAERFCIEMFEDEYIDFRVEYDPKDKSIGGMVIVHGPEDTDGFYYFPTIDEKKMLIDYIESYTQEHYGETVSEYIRDTKAVAQ